MSTLLETFHQIFQESSLPLPIHTEGVSSFWTHPEELFFFMAFRLGSSQKTLPLDTPDYRFCETILQKVSRSFALVIQTLPEGLRISVCVFYLILRALDTIEDDMITYKGKNGIKEALLRKFADTLSKPWSGIDAGNGEEKVLLEQFPKVLSVFQSLSSEDQRVITDITRQMGNGMADFLEKNIRLGTTSLTEYNLYCHIVAGLVGQGLTKLFVNHGKEDKALLNMMKEADEMGMFLQKINIVRDYLEDLNEGRTFWPQEIWKKHASSLLELRRGDKYKSLECLNELLLDAYQHLPAILRYLEAIKDPQVFKFCAIPQVMAIATLERLVNNPDVFTGIVKIRKGLMLSLFQYTSSIEEVKGIVSTYSDAFLSSFTEYPTLYKKANLFVSEVQALCSDGIQPSKPWPTMMSLLLSVSVLIYAFLQNGNRQWVDLLLLISMCLFMGFKKLSLLSQKMFSKDSS